MHLMDAIKLTCTTNKYRMIVYTSIQCIYGQMLLYDLHSLVEIKHAIRHMLRKGMQWLGGGTDGVVFPTARVYSMDQHDVSYLIEYTHMCIQ